MPTYKIRYTIVAKNIYSTKIIASEDESEVELISEIEINPERHNWKLADEVNEIESDYEILGVES
jgi:hypothetical protein